MKKVSELLKKRPATVWSIHPEDSVYEAIRILEQRSVGVLVVIENDRLAGILSERDYTRKIALQNKNSKETQVRDIMTADVLVVNPDSTTQECMALMSGKNIRHLPVVDGASVVGMVSIRDLMNDLIADQQMTIAQLESYIHG